MQSAMTPASRRLFQVIAMLALARDGGLFGFALSPLWNVADDLLRFRGEFQLRHREPQHLLDRARGSGCADRHSRLRRAFFLGDVLSDES